MTSNKAKISREVYNFWNFKILIPRTVFENFLLLGLFFHLDWPSVQNGDLIYLHQTWATGKPWEELVETSDPEVMRQRGSGQGGRIISRIFPGHCRFLLLRTGKLQSHLRMVTGAFRNWDRAGVRLGGASPHVWRRGCQSAAVPCFVLLAGKHLNNSPKCVPLVFLGWKTLK